MGELAERWELVVGGAVGSGNTSLVLRCRRPDGSAGMLKLTPAREVGVLEAMALRSWAFSGRVPAVWGHDPRLGALLLEAMPSETPLSNLRTTHGLGDIAALIGALHRAGGAPAAGGIEPLANRIDFIFDHWAERHRHNPAAARAIPVDQLRRGHELARALAAEPGQSVLLHGDLHPGNVLDGGPTRGLVAIDPRPCIGDPSFDAVDWVFWRADTPAEWEVCSRELAVALQLDPERLWTWCSVLAPVLATSAALNGRRSGRVEALRALAP